MQSIDLYHGLKFYHQDTPDFIYTIKKNIDDKIGWIVTWVQHGTPGSGGYSEESIKENIKDGVWILTKSDYYEIY